jgi:hypothetical protein
VSVASSDPVNALLRELDALDLDGSFAFGEATRMKLATAVGDAHERAIAEIRALALATSRQARAPGAGTHVGATTLHPKTPEIKGVHAGDGSAPRRHRRGRA